MMKRSILSGLLTLLLGLVFSTSAWGKTYAEGYREAVAKKKDLVVFVNVPEKNVPGFVCCSAPVLEGYPQKCVVIAVPEKATLAWYQTLPAEAAVEKIKEARSDGGFEGSVEALDEVNAARASRGLPPFTRDPGLTVAARSAAVYRAARHMEGHTPNDFAHLPAGAHATAAGCAAWEPSWGWGSCCAYENWTYAGAAFAVGRDGRRYMHLFVR